MKYILFFLCMGFLIRSGFIQVFPTAPMDGNDYAYRSLYLMQGIQELQILFAAGTSSKTNAQMTLSLPKFTYSNIDGNYTENMVSPKSIAINTTILLKNDINDSILWNMDESNKYRILSLYPSHNYFTTNGIKSERYDISGILCESFTLKIIFDVLATELQEPYNVGRLTAIVSLLITKSTTASSTKSFSFQVLLLNTSKSSSDINTSIPTKFTTCTTETDCNVSPISYKLNDDAIFRFMIDDVGSHETYYLKNLVVTMGKDSDPSIDVTSIITILSPLTKKGEIIFKLPVIMIPEQYLIISVQATLSTTSSRILESEDQNQGIIDFIAITIGNEEVESKTVWNKNYLVSLLVPMLFILFI